MVLELTGIPSNECVNDFGSDYIKYLEKHKSTIEVKDFREYFGKFIKDSTEGLTMNVLKFFKKIHLFYL